MPSPSRRNTPPEKPQDPIARLRAWFDQNVVPLGGKLDDGLSAVEQRSGLTRRHLLGLAAAGGAAVAAGGLAVVLLSEDRKPPIDPIPPGDPEPETLKGPRTVEFFGHRTEILDEVHFNTQVEKARQYLLLKYSTPGKVVGDNGERRDETKDEYWKRALETEFRDVLIEMDRHRPFIEAQAKALGVDPDILAFFGIEAGFNPLKRSPSYYCGISQIGTDAVADVRDHTACELKIKADQMDEKGDWYDLRYHPLYGIASGVAYIGHLEATFPETVQALLKKHRNPNKDWLMTVVDTTSGATRLDQLEQKVGLEVAQSSYLERYGRLLAHILPPHDVAIADPGSFAICSYNMGETGVARQVLLNFVEEKAGGAKCWREGSAGVSPFNLDDKPENGEKRIEIEEVPAHVVALGVSMGYALRMTDTPLTTEERATYLWQAYVFRELAHEWMALNPGESMTISFKGTEYRLQKPPVAPPTYLESMEQVEVLQVPTGTDLVRLAEHLKLDERPHADPADVDHFEAFRLGGNAPFVRGIAVNQAPPKSGKLKEEMLTIRIPKAKAEAAKTWLEEQGATAQAHLYKVRSGDSASGLLKRLKHRNPSVPKEMISMRRIFWQYNRMGTSRASDLDVGELLVLPGDLDLG